MDARVKRFFALFPFVWGCATSAELDEERSLPAPPGDDAASGIVDGSTWTNSISDAPDAELDSGSVAVEAGAEPTCDPRFSFSPSKPAAGEPFTASFTDEPGYVDVQLGVTGPGAPVSSWLGVVGEGPFTWSYDVEGHMAGLLELVFFKNKPPGSNGKKVGACSLQVAP